MSFAGYKDVIEENDLVILYINFSTSYPVKVTEKTLSKKGKTEIENILQTKYGCLKVADLIGKKFGTKVNLTKGYAFVLHPTPELWTKALPHRTQILYATDISMIIMQLELKPGSVVIESGTGSGSLSHSLIRTIAPTGHVHTFDFHAQRVEKAQEEFREHGIGHLVTCKHRDVCAEGFELEDRADAVFLDLPHPWLAVPHAKKSLKKSGGRLCSFSPCIEQVQQTCVELKNLGFTEISTIECLLREFQVRKINLPTFDPDFDPLATQEENKEETPLDEGEKGDGAPGKREREEGEDENSAKKKRPERRIEKETKFVSGLPLVTMPGHTGYLTFATLPPQL